VDVVTPRLERVLVVLSWSLAGFAVFAAASGLFAWWAANAESFGKRDAGLAIFFAFSSAYALIACLWLAPASAVLALAAWLTRKGSAPALLLAAAAGALPFLILSIG
jgi:hypothetical protein